MLAAVCADTGMSATKIQEALGAVLAAAQSKRSRGKGGGGGKGAGGANTPKAVDLGANKKTFLVNVCGLVCRDAKYYIDGPAGGEVAQQAVRPVAHDGAPPKTATGDGGRGLGGGGGASSKGRLLSLWEKQKERRPFFQTTKAPGDAQVSTFRPPPSYTDIYIYIYMNIIIYTYMYMI